MKIPRTEEIKAELRTNIQVIFLILFEDEEIVISKDNKRLVDKAFDRLNYYINLL